MLCASCRLTPLSVSAQRPPSPAPQVPHLQDELRRKSDLVKKLRASLKGGGQVKLSNGILVTVKECVDFRPCDNCYVRVLYRDEVWRCAGTRIAITEGGGISWHFNFAFQIDREISHAKFRVLHEFLVHQQYTLWTLAGGTAQNPGARRNFPQRNSPPQI